MSRKAVLTDIHRATIRRVAYALAEHPKAAELLTQEIIAESSGFSISSVRKVIGSINNFRKLHKLPSLGEQATEVRRETILTAALTVARSPGGWSTLTREAVAREAKCTDGLVSKYFGTMTDFRRTIMRAAIAQRDLRIIGQALACEYPHAYKADPALRKEALGSIPV